MAIDDRIRYFRKVRGLSQEELAEKAGVSRVSVGFYERGERIPPADVATRIANALQISVEHLLIGHGLENQTPDDDERFDRTLAILEWTGFNLIQDESSSGTRWKIRYKDYNIDTVEDEERLMAIVDVVLRDAEARKDLYVKKRLIAEFDGSPKAGD